jgi:hypothetical protein
LITVSQNETERRLLILVLIGLWAAILTPIGFKWLRDRSTDLKLDRFRDERSALSRRDISVAPAHTLESDVDDIRPLPARRRVASETARPRVNPASAYSKHDRDERVYADVRLARTQQHERRRRVILTLLATTALSTVASLAVSWTIVTVLAVMSWLSLAAYIGLMFWMMWQSEGADLRPTAFAEVEDLDRRRSAARRVEPDEKFEEDFDYRFTASRSQSFARSRAPRAAAH